MEVIGLGDSTSIKQLGRPLWLLKILNQILLVTQGLWTFFSKLSVIFPVSTKNTVVLISYA